VYITIYTVDTGTLNMNCALIKHIDLILKLNYRIQIFFSPSLTIHVNETITKYLHDNIVYHKCYPNG
jgi:hypothetical protein